MDSYQREKDKEDGYKHQHDWIDSISDQNKLQLLEEEATVNQGDNCCQRAEVKEEEAFQESNSL